MPRSPKQKLKLLYIMQILMEKTDENHPISTGQLIKSLAANDVAAERKSIYDDIETLRSFGVDIGMCKPRGYFIASRDFELPELKLLVDSVQASQFITERKTIQLIKKLEKLCSAYEAQLMRRQVYVSGRIKHMNESIYYSVDAIHSGIAGDKQISFKYFDYTVEKKKKYRHGGGTYIISPFALTWDNENYYMIGYDTDADMIKHYRVDRMESIAVTDREREGREAFEAHDMDIYTRRMFSMYGGETVRVDMEFENHLVGVVMDRFGKDVFIAPSDSEHFTISAPVVVSPQFYAWIFGLGAEARITGPKEVADGMRDMAREICKQYSDD